MQTRRSQPKVQTTDTDGRGPRRRRRPALSCVECRIRKVKCNREKPCMACRKTESATCSYRSRHIVAPSQNTDPPYLTPASASGSNGSFHEDEPSSQQPPPPPSHPLVNEFDLMINRYIAPGLLGQHGPPPLRLSSTCRPGADPSSLCSDSGHAIIIELLLERIKVLEGKQNATAEDVPYEKRNDLYCERESVSSLGQFLKTRFFGQSHWMNAIEPYDALRNKSAPTAHNLNGKEPDRSTALYSAVTEMKRMARLVKIPRLRQPIVPSELTELVPPKNVCDLLINCYFRTLEGPFRVLHVPTFRREYENHWTQTTPAKPSVLLKILLVCAIGSHFHNGSDQAQLRQSSRKWIQAAADWLNAPNVKSRLNMGGIQIHILMLIARQICNVDGDLIWISAGSLLRAAMHLGLHRDPSHFENIGAFHGEMRRRLWATVLEITTQSSLDMGMPPLISVNDYDTRFPGNIDDEDIQEDSDALAEAKSPETFTDSSIQIRFAQTLPVRLEIIRRINNLRLELSYKEVLHLSTQLTTACGESSSFFLSALAAGSSVHPFQIKLLDSLVRRFVLCLHRPYYAKAIEGTQYHYSRKICLDTSLSLYAPATALQPGEKDDWTRMTYTCAGFFKSFFWYAMTTVYMELNTLVKERRNASVLLTPLVSTFPSPILASSQLPLEMSEQFQTLRTVLESARNIGVTRIRNGETNAKGVAFLTCALARLDALVSGTDADEAVLEAAKSSAREMGRIMIQTYSEEYGEDISLSHPSAPALPGQESRRNPRADNARRENTSTMSNKESEINEQLGILGKSTNDANVQIEELGNTYDVMELDFNVYLQGQSVETELGYDFATSPEWPFDLDSWEAFEDDATSFLGVI